MAQRSDPFQDGVVEDDNSDGGQQKAYHAGGCNNYVLQVIDFIGLGAAGGGREEEGITAREISEFCESADLVCCCRQTDGGLSRGEQGERSRLDSLWLDLIGRLEGHVAADRLSHAGEESYIEIPHEDQYSPCRPGPRACQDRT